MSDPGRGHRGRGSRSHEIHHQQLPRRPGQNEINQSSPLAESSGAGRAAVHPRESAAAVDPVRVVVIAGSSSSTSEALPVTSRGASRYRNESRSVTRPPVFNKTGTIGRPIDIRSNYFQLIQKMDMPLLHYHVDFKPEIEQSWIKKGLLRQHQQLLEKYSFDGTSLFSVKRLAQPLELSTTRNSDGSVVTITLRLVGELQKEDRDYQRVINIIFRRCLAMLNLVLMNRDYFDPEAEEVVRNHPITIWPGYRTTINRREGGEHLLLAEIIHKFLRQDTASNVMDKIRRESNDNLEQRIKAELVGKIVMTVYNKKTYRIDDVDFEKNASSTFYLRKKDRDITYADYYRTQYQKDIRQLTQPLLLSRPSRRDVNRGDVEPIYLIPELCGMTGLSDDQRKNFTTMREISSITRVNPDKRVQNLLKFRDRLEKTPEIKSELSSWGIQFANHLVTCKGRVLPTRKIMLGNQRSAQATNGDWSRSMHNAKMVVSLDLNDWVVICPQSLRAKVQSFINLMKTVGDAQDFFTPVPVYVSLPTDRADDYVRALNEQLSVKDYQIAICVLRSNRTDIYNAIKNVTLSTFGIPSQVITEKILNGDISRQRSVATKVMTQIACKLGAEPWQIDMPKTKWMVIGYDTYHDARQKKAVGAFVASVNHSYTRFHSSVKIHEANEEISNNFRDYTTSSLRAYYIENKDFPEQIIVYRDGVGVGNFDQVIEVEVNSIKSACDSVREEIKKPNWNPGIAYIIVSKRINTRFFTNSPRPENPLCGTVVDNVVTHADHFNFYLISQKVNQGTVSPTMYDVIYDTTNLTPDIHQQLAYALTQLYYNWAGTLRVPAPIQYAHKLAYLVGENMGKRLPHENLANFPYYL